MVLSMFLNIYDVYTLLRSGSWFIVFNVLGYYKVVEELLLYYVLLMALYAYVVVTHPLKWKFFSQIDIK